MKILIIEDSDLLRESIIRCIEKEKQEVDLYYTI